MFQIDQTAALFDIRRGAAIVSAMPAAQLDSSSQSRAAWMPAYASAHGYALHPRSLEDHRETGGRSGRLYEVGGWSVQQLPRELRPAVLPHDPTWQIVSIDVRASHLRCLASESGDQALAAYLDERTQRPDGSTEPADPYLRLLPGVPRERSKVALNIMLNGGGDALIAERIGCSVSEAAQITASIVCRFMDIFPVAWAWWQSEKTADAIASDADRSAGGPGWTPGIGARLQRGVERTALDALLAEVDRMGPAVARVLAPMHDGALISVAPKAAHTAISTLGTVYARAIRKVFSLTPDQLNSTLKVTTQTPGWGWEADAAPLVDTRAPLTAVGRAALTAAEGGDIDATGLLIAVLTLPPKTVDASLKSIPNASKAKQAVKAAQAKASEFRELMALDAGVHMPSLGKSSHKAIVDAMTHDKTAPKTFFHVPSQTIFVGGERLTDARIGDVRCWYEGRYLAPVSATGVHEALCQVAEGHRLDPVREYLDGVAAAYAPSVDGEKDKALSPALAQHVLGDLLGLSSDMETMMVYKALLSMVARTYQPGCQVDTVLVLYGAQGAKKSRWLRALFPEATGAYTTEAVNPSDKDFIARITGRSVVEWGEMAGTSKREVESIRDFLTRSEDRFRVAYGHVQEDHPRRSVFVATTNRIDILSDREGTRRWWPVTVGKTRETPIDLQTWETIRDRLWAGMVHAYRAWLAQPSSTRAPLWWLTPEEEDAREVLSAPFKEDAEYASEIRIFYATKGQIPCTPGDIVAAHQHLTNAGNRKGVLNGVAGSLRAMGFTVAQKRVGGVPTKVYVPPVGFGGGSARATMPAVESAFA